MAYMSFLFSEGFQTNRPKNMKTKGIILGFVCVSVLMTIFNAVYISRSILVHIIKETFSRSTEHNSRSFKEVSTTVTASIKSILSAKEFVITKSVNESIMKIYARSWNKVITPYASKYMIDGRNICSVLPLPSLLIFVLSLPKAKEERQAIRKTWGSVANRSHFFFNISTKIVFVLGQMADAGILQVLQDESNEYKDMVQIDFIESRYNLTRKMMHGLRWVKTYCKSIKYILKADDDTFINVARLSDYLLRDADINNDTIHGFMYRTGGTVLREGKYAVKEEELPSPRYPPYVSGTAYILPYNVISNMLDLAERLPYCPVDDAFMTGVLRVILDIKIKHTDNFTDMFQYHYNPCKFQSQIAVTNINTECMYLLWNLTTQEKDTDCERSKLYDKQICSIFG
ncbi:hypothetical protein CHS0354_039049 [Potamilus streckersoni]|uniref:Hexosyltransferase n=1 Tax=Potamilus streckersoni TaxID=2493646 RepID=A0AAE0VIQ1_9BIVA|nr:hypothetical protein CHS0354_039049 [Potamilus streckersoni]